MHEFSTVRFLAVRSKEANPQFVCCGYGVLFCLFGVDKH
jgi:hypothetical protein